MIMRKNGERKESDPCQILRIRIDKTGKAGEPINTKTCNLQCLSCHHDYFVYPDSSVKTISNEMFTAAVRKVIYASQVSQAIVYLAGSGEPTTVGETELVDLIFQLKQIPQVVTVIMTTNGLLLEGMAQPLKQAGLDEVRVSLNSLDEENYRQYTGVYGLQSVLQGIEAALSAGLIVKVNVIYSKRNAQEIAAFIRFAQSHNDMVIKFFPLIPTNGVSGQPYLPLCQLEQQLQSVACEVVFSKRFYPSHLYLFEPSGRIEVKGFADNDCVNLACAVRSACLEECRDAVRIGLDGIMRPCGMRQDNVVNLLDPLIQARDIKQALISGGKLLS